MLSSSLPPLQVTQQLEKTNMLRMVASRTKAFKPVTDDEGRGVVQRATASGISTMSLRGASVFNFAALTGKLH